MRELKRFMSEVEESRYADALNILRRRRLCGERWYEDRRCVVVLLAK
jgi:hypothetical protein